MTFAGFQLLPTHGGVGGDRINQLGNFRRAFPVILEPVVSNDRVFLVGNELERTGADRCSIDSFLGTGGLHFIRVFGRHNGSEIHRQVGDKRSIRLVQRELDRVVVDLVDGIKRRAHIHPAEVQVLAAGNTVIRVVFLPLTIEAVEYIVGVEIAGWGEVLVGVPLYASTQFEGIFQTIGRYTPGLG